VPEWKEKEAEYLTGLVGMDLCTKFPIHEQSKYEIHEGGLKDMYLANVWGANLSVCGIDDIPAIMMAGNVVRPATSVRLSMRLCPMTDPAKALAVMKEKLTTNVPYNAKVTLTNDNYGPGWCMRDP